jgi:hypothetical protein
MCILSTFLELPGKIARAQGEGMSITDAENEQFMKIVDELVMNAETDSELAEGLRWIDVQSREKGLTFYEMAFIVLKKHMAERRAKEWLKNKATS